MFMSKVPRHQKSKARLFQNYSKMTTTTEEATTELILELRCCYLFCVPMTSPATRMYVTNAITANTQKKQGKVLLHWSVQNEIKQCLYCNTQETSESNAVQWHHVTFALIHECRIKYSRSSLNRHSCKWTALLTATLTKPYGYSSSYKLCIISP